MSHSTKDAMTAVVIIAVMFVGTLLAVLLPDSSPNDPPAIHSDTLVSQTPQMPVPGR